MTNFAVQSTLGAVAPLVSKDKGSFGNRMNCAGEHIKNNAGNAVETAGVIGGSAVAYGIANKMTKGKAFEWNTKINNRLKGFVKHVNKVNKECSSSHVDFNKGVTKKGKNFLINKYGKVKGRILKTIENLAIKIINGAKAGAEKLSKTSGRQKILGALALGALATFTAVQKKHSYQAGQIDQKYTDKAKMEKNLV